MLSAAGAWWIALRIIYAGLSWLWWVSCNRRGGRLSGLRGGSFEFHRDLAACENITRILRFEVASIP